MCILCGDYVNLSKCVHDCDVGSLSFVSNSAIEGIYVVALTPDASTISGATFHSLSLMLLMSG